jgi:hypothetical protein
MTETDPFNLTQLGATYYSLMDARYYYGELVVCDELQTVHTAMLNVLMGMSDTAATTFFAIANSDSASTYKTISENTIGPRFDEYLQILLDETERLTNQ